MMLLLDPGKTAVLEVELECCCGLFASSADFDVSVVHCLSFLKIIGAEVFAVQGLSGCTYRSFASLVPRVFVRGSPEVLTAPLEPLRSRLRANGWISADLAESGPVQFLTFVFSWRATDLDVESREVENILRLWLIKERLPCELKVFFSLLITMADSFTAVRNASQLSIFKLGDRRQRNTLLAVQSCFWNQECSPYDHFDDGLVRAARQVLTRVGDVYVTDCVQLWI